MNCSEIDHHACPGVASIRFRQATSESWPFHAIVPGMRRLGSFSEQIVDRADLEIILSKMIHQIVQARDEYDVRGAEGFQQLFPRAFVFLGIIVTNLSVVDEIPEPLHRIEHARDHYCVRCAVEHRNDTANPSRNIKALHRLDGETGGFIPVRNDLLHELDKRRLVPADEM